ncbi:MAG: hypothetical protein KJ955_05275 [Nanoarchaeota archaeon]|nr:hypothetical protein [Nanoarchaeota archaeon]
MEDIKEAYERLMQSEAFCTGEKGEDSYLSSFSLMAETNKLEAAKWQIDYFSPSAGKMTSFLMKDIIEVRPDQAILGGGSKPIEMDAVKVEFKEAFAKAEASLKSSLNETSQSIIAVLQNRNTHMWIITFITTSMKVACIEIDAQTGDVISEKAGSFTA